jgi:proteasome lid subunit RPN8/RPN11
VIGFYHSHPDHPAVPSQFDLDHAWPVYSYLIVSVIQGQSAELTSWELVEDRSRFEAEPLVELEGE